MSEKRWTKLRQARYFHKLTHNSFTKNENASLENSIRLLQSSAKSPFEITSPSNLIRKNELTRSAKLLKRYKEVSLKEMESQSPMKIRKELKYATVNMRVNKLPMQTIKEVVQKLFKARAVKNAERFKASNHNVNIPEKRDIETNKRINSPHEKLLIMKSDKYLLEKIYKRHRHKDNYQLNEMQEKKNLVENKTLIYRTKKLQLVQTQKTLVPDYFNKDSNPKGKYIKTDKRIVNSNMSMKKIGSVMESIRTRHKLVSSVNKKSAKESLSTYEREIEYGIRINDLLCRLKKFSDKV